jgi:hypothetical protein
MEESLLVLLHSINSTFLGSYCVSQIDGTVRFSAVIVVNVLLTIVLEW